MESIGLSNSLPNSGSCNLKSETCGGHGLLSITRLTTRSVSFVEVLVSLVLFWASWIACCLLLTGCSLVMEPAWMESQKRSPYNTRLTARGRTDIQTQVDQHERLKLKTISTANKSRNGQIQVGDGSFSGTANLRYGAPAAPGTTTDWSIDLMWSASPSSNVQAYEVLYGTGTSTNLLTNSVITFGNTARVSGLGAGRYYFGVRASDGQANSKLSNLVKSPPDIIYSGWVQRGPLAGPYTNFVQLFRFTNSPPAPEQGFKTTISTEKNYAP